jgi:hypothetical protein
MKIEIAGGGVMRVLEAGVAEAMKRTKENNKSNPKVEPPCTIRITQAQEAKVKRFLRREFGDNLRRPVKRKAPDPISCQVNVLSNCDEFFEQMSQFFDETENN